MRGDAGARRNGVGAVRRERGLHLLLNFELLAELRLQEALDNLLVFLREKVQVA